MAWQYGLQVITGIKNQAALHLAYIQRLTQKSLNLNSVILKTFCPYLAETKTECMQPLNNDFKYTMPELKDIPNKYSFPDNEEVSFNAGSISIPVFAFN